MPAETAVATYEDAATRVLIERLSHHVRSPLAGISGALDILRDRAALAAEDQLIVGEILDRLRSLNGSLDSLVDLARPLAPKRQPTRLRELIADCAGRLDAPAGLEVGVDPEVDRIVVDVDLLRRALGQLLTNAAEAGGAGAIVVRARADAGGCRIEISDHGGGWRPEIYARIFEPFVTSKSQHLGVGLAIARRIALAHGGMLDCTRADDTGTTMTLWLPQSPAHVGWNEA